jgi:hypothetical protein
MKTLCLKTEDALKYLSVHLLDDAWVIDITPTGTGLKNTQTKEAIFIVDLNENNTVLYTNLSNTPINWTPRDFYYYPETNLWEFIPPIEEPIFITVEEPITVLTE